MTEGTIVLLDTLHIGRVTFNAGPPTYTCQIIYELDGTADMAEGTIILKQHLSAVLGVISNTDHLHAGEELRALCRTAPDSVPIWLNKSGDRLGSRFSVDNFGLMTVENVQPQDEGIYLCCASVFGQTLKREQCHNYTVVVRSKTDNLELHNILYILTRIPKW